MDNILVLVLAGFVIGTFGTLIGAGGGFILVPLLILSNPQMPPEIITAISIFIVAVNAISGSLAYARSGRIDYRAGLLFALFTIPGSILGVFATQYIPQRIFNMSFGILLILLAVYLLVRTLKPAPVRGNTRQPGKGWIYHSLTDKEGAVFSYTYNQPYGIIVSVLVGFLSPLLGIGGGIIHVPAMVNWLQFPVYIATATSHFILAIMSTVSVVVHVLKGSYKDPAVLKMVLALSVGVIPGAQLGAFFSHKIKSSTIIQILAACLILVGVRILLKSF
jgi:uncharacterized membrane protein YfcA